MPKSSGPIYFMGLDWNQENYGVKFCSFGYQHSASVKLLHSGQKKVPFMIFKDILYVDFCIKLYLNKTACNTDVCIFLF